MTSSDTGRLLSGALLLALLATVLAGVACGGSRPAEDRTPAVLVQAGEFAITPPGTPAGEETGPEPLRFDAAPRLETVTLDDETRPAIVLPAEGGVSSWTWRVRVPADGWLQLGVGLVPEPGAESGPGAAPEIRGTVTLDRGTSARSSPSSARPRRWPTARTGRRPGARLGSRSEDGPSPDGWIDAGADLSDWAGREVTLQLSARLVEAPATEPGKRASRGWTRARQVRELAWGPVAVAPARPDPALRRAGQPNVLFILVDTLRRDHLTPYGYERETSPEMARWLAERGAVVEDAYSQAPWTLPSVVSFMTSRYPGEILHGDPATFGIPDGVPALAEVFSGLGYRTGGFFANPTLHVEQRLRARLRHLLLAVVDGGDPGPRRLDQPPGAALARAPTGASRSSSTSTTSTPTTPT